MTLSSRALQAKPISCEAELGDHLKCHACSCIAVNAFQTRHGCRLCQDCVANKLDKTKRRICPCTPGPISFRDEDEIKELLVNQMSCYADTAIRREVSKLAVRCPHSDCQEQMEWNAVEAHLNGYCDFELIICNHCGQRVVLHQLHIGSHYNLDSEHCCISYRGNCPLCGDATTNLSRDNFVEHKKSCRNRLLKCKYGGIGCPVEASSAQLDEHYHDGTDKHLHMIVDRLCCENRMMEETQTNQLNAIRHQRERESGQFRQELKQMMEEMYSVVELRLSQQLLQSELALKLKADLQELVQNELTPKLRVDLQELVKNELTPKLKADLQDLVQNELTPKLKVDLQELVQNELTPKLKMDLQELVQNELTPKLKVDLQELVQNELTPKLKVDLQELVQNELTPKLKVDLQELVQKEVEEMKKLLLNDKESKCKQDEQDTEENPKPQELNKNLKEKAINLKEEELNESLKQQELNPEQREFKPDGSQEPQGMKNRLILEKLLQLELELKKANHKLAEMENHVKKLQQKSPRHGELGVALEESEEPRYDKVLQGNPTKVVHEWRNSTQKRRTRSVSLTES